MTMGCSASFESASVPQRTGGLGGVPATAGGTSVPTWSVTASDSRSSCSRGGSPSQAASRAKARLVRGSVVRTVCPSSDLVAEVSKRRRTQRSHQGGGRGSSSPAGNRAGAKRRRAHAVHETARNGSVEGHLLAEGALGRRSRHSSRGRRGRWSWSRWLRGVRIGLRGGDESVRARCCLDARMVNSHRSFEVALSEVGRGA